MPRSSRPADKRRQPSTPPPRAASQHSDTQRAGAQHYGSVDGKRYAGTVVGPEHAWSDEGAGFEAEPGSDEWE